MCCIVVGVITHGRVAGVDTDQCTGENGNDDTAPHDVTIINGLLSVNFPFFVSVGCQGCDWAGDC